MKQLVAVGLGFTTIVALSAFLGLSARIGTDVAITDVHFHPCSFSHDCVPLDQMTVEMDKAGVETAWIFGLQHQMQVDPSPIETWPDANTCPLTTPMALPAEPDLGTCQRIHAELARHGARPFHYNDPCANPGWPMTLSHQADETIFAQYANLSPEKKQRLRPFLSHLDFDDPCAQTASGENSNLAYVKAMDRTYPRAIFGFAEHNLNKQVLFSHNVCRPDLEQWRTCSGGLMTYIAETRRPLGIHFDIQDDQGTSYDKPLIDFAGWFPETIMIWQHAGIAPEVNDRLTAQEHIAIMQRFLDTSPGKRYLGLSWPNGFFRRLNDEELEKDQYGWPIARDSEADRAAYLAFFEQNSEALLFGSDQVSLFYGETTVLGTKLHNAYTNDYKETIDTEVLALRTLFGSTEAWGDEGDRWRALMHANAERIIAAIDWDKVAALADP